MNPPSEIIIKLVELFTQKEFDELEGKVEILTKQYPNSCQLWNLLGSAHLGLGKNETAIKNFKKSIKKDPKYAPAHNNMANALRLSGKNEEALTSYSKALQIEPNFVDAYIGKANCLKDINKLDEAEENLQRANMVSKRQSETKN